MRDNTICLWATGDGVRVSPTTGRYLEDRGDIHTDYPSGDYQQRNAVWEAETETVRLKAARNEFVSFQLVVESTSPVQGVKVVLNRLTGPEGAEITGRNVAVFKAWYVEVQQPSSGYEGTSLGPGWYPDALVPVEEGAPLRFDLPDPQNGVGPTQRNQTVWVDIYVPRDREDAPPGEYVGALQVSGPGVSRELRIELEVWDFSLPEEIHCRGDIYNNSLNHLDPAVELRYFQLARQHRFQPGIVYHRPELTLEGTEVSIDWTAYDARLMPYLDGSAYTEEQGYWGPGYGVPIDHLVLPFDCGKHPARRNAWPMKMPDEGPTPEFEAVWEEAGRQLRDHFDADPHRRGVEKIAFLEGLDEAYYDEAYQQMVYYCELLRRGMGKGWFKHRIDGGFSREAMQRLHPHVDLWVCHTIAFDAETVAEFSEKGVEASCYGPMVYEKRENSACGSNTFLDLDMLTCRGLAWATWKHRCGYCEWEFDWRAEQAWTEALNWVTEHVEYNGSGLLIYRGEPMGLQGPVPSIRLKAHRRGFQDYEYFWLLATKGKSAEADQLVDSIIHKTPFGQASIGDTEIWVNDPESWDRARVKAGQLLHAVEAASE